MVKLLVRRRRGLERALSRDDFHSHLWRMVDLQENPYSETWLVSQIMIREMFELWSSYFRSIKLELRVRLGLAAQDPPGSLVLCLHTSVTRHRTHRHLTHCHLTILHRYLHKWNGTHLQRLKIYIKDAIETLVYTN
ncbi:hypothetical protein EVAR_81716_1 [Eumeta japonica]|uniref:Uncharacterized protein n=1 Tax=Eumeta variegata TaxID=151549 RepID=A0A4C1UIB5_EUMVA|nr:hypothetical protein EVAR_81716_1 [Eumeta japonica]